jgi:membrane protease YdiL (CAAX protease family)
VTVSSTFTTASVRRVLVTALILGVAIGGAMLVAVLNSVWFDLVNGVVQATGAVARGLLYSSWLVLLGGAIVLRRPSAFGFRWGDTTDHIGLIAATTGAAALATLAIVRAVGPIPYSDASLLIEAVDVPITEELVFRGVLLTALLGALGRLWSPRQATVLAVVFDGLAFGVAHLANAASWTSMFVVGQAVFATILGILCAGLMARTRSIYPAILLHAAVNAAVVLGS